LHWSDRKVWKPGGGFLKISFFQGPGEWVHICGAILDQESEVTVVGGGVKERLFTSILGRRRGWRIPKTLETVEWGGGGP